MAKTTDITVKGTDVRILNRRIDGLPTVKIHNPVVQDLLLGVHTDDLVEYVQQYIAIEEIYPTSTLEKWAEANGYVKEEDSRTGLDPNMGY